MNPSAAILVFATEPQEPHPVRFWWLQRQAVACVLLGVSLAGLRVWWGWEAERRTRAALGPAVARGRSRERSALRVRLRNREAIAGVQGGLSASISDVLSPLPSPGGRGGVVLSEITSFLS